MTEHLSMEEARPLLEAHGTDQVEEAYRRIVLRSPKDFPVLSSIEQRKNAYNFDKGTR